MKSLWLLPPALLLAALLGACAASPPEPAQPYYNGPITAASLAGIGRISIRPEVPHPARTRYSSIGSRLPFYGMLLPDKPAVKPAPAPFGEFALAPRLNVATVSTTEFRRQLASSPALASRIAEQGDARFQIDIVRISIFGKDVSNVSCQPLVLMQIRLIDASGRLRWHSGLTGNRIDERVNYPCQDIQHKPEVAARAISEALHTAISGIIARI